MGSWGLDFNREFLVKIHHTDRKVKFIHNMFGQMAPPTQKLIGDLMYWLMEFVYKILYTIKLIFLCSFVVAYMLNMSL